MGRKQVPTMTWAKEVLKFLVVLVVLALVGACIVGALMLFPRGKQHPQRRVDAKIRQALYVSEGISGTLYITEDGVYRILTDGRPIKDDFSGSDIAFHVGPGHYAVKNHRDQVLSYAIVDAAGVIRSTASPPPRR